MRKQTTMGSGLHESMAHFIETLIQKRDFVAVVEYYDAHRLEIDGAGDDLAGSMLRWIAMAHASLSHYPIALKIARTAQAKAARLGESVLLAEIFMTIGGILRDMGELKEAERAFRDAESIFRRNDCPEGQSRALNLLAGLFFHMNDYKNSLAILMDAVQIARKLGDRKKLAYMMGESALEYAGPGLREVCEAVGMPPVLHMGSCVDNSRILTVLSQMAQEGGLGDDISDIPAVGMAPEWMSEKAISIATYCVASGAYVIMGVSSPVEGSEEVVQLISEGWESKVGGKLHFVEDPEEIVKRTIEHIDKKRADLGLAKYDASKWGRSGDGRIGEVLELPLEERLEAVYGGGK